MKEWPPPEAKSPKLLWWERASSQVMIPLRGTRATGAPLASAEDEVMPLAPVAIWSRRGASVAPQSSRSQVSSSAGLRLAEGLPREISSWHASAQVLSMLIYHAMSPTLNGGTTTARLR